MGNAAFWVGIIGLVFALAAAVYWEQASRVKIPTTWNVDAKNELASYVQWIIAIKDASEKSGKLNALAARLTALSVLLAAVAAVLSAAANGPGH
jgi:hypothetical protein